jgi:hypothetical protein
LAVRIDQHDAIWQLDEKRLPRDEPMVATWFDDPASSVNAVGDDETGDG